VKLVIVDVVRVERLEDYEAPVMGASE
jgi:hypothetical protein